MDRKDFLLNMLTASILLWSYINLPEDKDAVFYWTLFFMIINASGWWAKSTSYKYLKKICNVMD